MNALMKMTRSTLGKKFLIAACGLAWAFFAITHMAGNLQLLLPTGDAYNLYSYRLISLGWLLYIAEAGLLVTILAHAALGIQTTVANRQARGDERYAVTRSKGGPSRSTWGSRNMILTGVVLLGFLVFHIVSFKYGPAQSEGYVTTVNGIEMRDLYRLVYERFQQPGYVGFYVLVMVLLGVHLRHGFWSAFQSLGAMSPRLARPIHCLGVLIAAALVVGFIVTPLWIFFDLKTVFGLGGNV